MFGYSRIKKDIIFQPRLVLGSTEREIPDILLCRNGKKLFVAELKRYSLSKNEKFEKQLLNYLTHTDIHLSIGILICEKIYIYCYDFSANKHISLEIPFEKDNSDGIRFVELFSKQNFDKKKIQDFVVSRKLASQNIAKIKESISVTLIKNLLKEHFSKEYSENDFEKAFAEFEITVQEKQTPVSESMITSQNLRELKGSVYSASLAKNDLSKEEIISICGTNGIIVGYDFTKSKLNKSTPRYWANPNVRFLSQDWWLVLLNNKEKKLYVFKIPANSIKSSEVKYKDKEKNLIDLQIYSDLKSYPYFENSRSGIKFEQWLVKTISY